MLMAILRIITAFASESIFRGTIRVSCVSCLPVMTTARPILYLKSGCSWCDEAEDYFKEHEIAYETKNVSVDSAAFAEMQRLSGQTKAPTLDWDGEILADFGVDELDAFLRDLGVIS